MEVPDDLVALSIHTDVFGSMLSLPIGLDLMAPLLAAAVDGDPATAVPTAA